MLLELDAGNSRLKWRLSSLAPSFAPVASGVVVDAGMHLPAAERARAALDVVLAQLASQVPTQVHVSSVRDGEFRVQCRQAFLAYCAVEPVFAEAKAALLGLRSGYLQAEKLGVDRWLAMLAAFQTEKGACCVLDCGTTITLDVVDEDGRHQGGYIVPGLHLQRDALAQRRPALLAGAQNAFITPERGDNALLPGRNTAEAIGHGVLSMVVGFINFQHRKMARLLADPAPGTEPVEAAAAPRWYLCGGDADLLAPYIEWEYSLAPDLVLDGLRLALSPPPHRV
jgi:type III pantothenate kinase